MTFKEDRLENEKNDPKESSSLKFINVPLVLLALFLGFGITFLALKTPNTSMRVGDSRTATAEAANGGAQPAQPAQAVVAGGSDLASQMAAGKQIYTTICQACHQANGAGIAGAFPPLAESEWVLGSGKKIAAIVLHGLQGEIVVKGQKYLNAMPAFKDQLKAEEIAAVATYVRNSFGNKADQVLLSDVEEVKEKTKDKASAWDGEAELKAQGWN